MSFRLTLLGLAGANAVICVLVEDVLIEIFLSQSSFARVFSKTKPYTTMLRLLKETQSSWPPLTQAGSEDVKKSEHDDDKSEASPRPLATNVEFQVVDENEAFQQFSGQVIMMHYIKHTNIDYDLYIKHTKVIMMYI